jgi:hypothetical protein
VKGEMTSKNWLLGQLCQIKKTSAVLGAEVLNKFHLKEGNLRTILIPQNPMNVLAGWKGTKQEKKE